MHKLAAIASKPVLAAARDIEEITFQRSVQGRPEAVIIPRLYSGFGKLGGREWRRGGVVQNYGVGALTGDNADFSWDGVFLAHADVGPVPDVSTFLAPAVKAALADIRG